MVVPLSGPHSMHAALRQAHSFLLFMHPAELLLQVAKLPNPKYAAGAGPCVVQQELAAPQCGPSDRDCVEPAGHVIQHGSAGDRVPRVGHIDKMGQAKLSNVCPASKEVGILWAASASAHMLVMDNHTMELDFVKQVEVAKDLASALAYLHAQGASAQQQCSKVGICFAKILAARQIY
eukprot:1160393-Pelagomonas_calceolata.AAC.1